MPKPEFEVIRDKDAFGPIQAEQRKQMQALAKVLDDYFNPTGKEGIVFAVLMTRTGDMKGGRVNYISNGVRSEMIEMTEEWLGRVKATDAGGSLANPPRLLPEDE
jgi:hypothetical protein